MDNVSRDDGLDVGISKANLRKINYVELLLFFVYGKLVDSLQETSKPAQHLDFLFFHGKYEKAGNECLFSHASQRDQMSSMTGSQCL